MKNPLLLLLLVITFDRFAAITAEFGSWNQVAGAVRTLLFGIQFITAVAAEIGFGGNLRLAFRATVHGQHLVSTAIAKTGLFRCVSMTLGTGNGRDRFPF